MSNISPELVKELREITGAGIMDCKAALVEAAGSKDAAIEILRKKGLKDLAKRSGRVAAEGVIGVYEHAGSQVVSIVELNCETDFVARSEGFKKTAYDIAMQIAAMRPDYVNESDVPQTILDKEKEILLEQLAPDQKSKADKIIAGRIQKFLDEVVLLRQSFVKDESGKKTVQNVLEELALQVGEKVTIRRFHRFEVGEGIEKKSTDLASEVAKTIEGR